MSKFVRLCEVCKKKSIGNPTLSSSLVGRGYSTYLKEDKYTCEFCGGTVIDLKMLSDDYKILTEISSNPDFIESMMQLQESDIIEYNLKMSQFRAQVTQMSDNTPKCPTCNSTNIEKISGTSKAVSVAMFGLLSQKVKKTYHCNSCGYEW